MYFKSTKNLLALLGCLLSLFALGQAVGQDNDPRHASLSCAVREGDVLTCQYRTAPSLVVKDVSLKIAGELVQIPEGGVSNFPAEGQTVAALILVDTSDPARKTSVEEISAKIVQTFLTSQKSYEEYGLATFDGELQLLAPIGSSAAQIQKEVSRIRATGHATEFYKSVLAGIEIVSKSTAERKGLVIISDGKDEDKAYKLDDVVKAAKQSNVAILGIGIAERLSETPYLQTLKRLSDETYGQFVNASTGSLSADFVNKPLGYIEKGGELKLDVTHYHGDKEITVVLGTKDDKSLELSTKVDFTEGRSGWKKIVGLIIKYWLWIAIFVVCLLFFVALFQFVKKSRAAKMSPVIDFAYLDEMDGLGTRHVLQKTAVRIGRNRDNDVVLTNDSISAHHSEIHIRREGTFYIVDLSSTNGVFVNDVRVNQSELHDGDTVELGEVRLRFSEAR